MVKPSSLPLAGSSSGNNTNKKTLAKTILLKIYKVIAKLTAKVPKLDNRAKLKIYKITIAKMLAKLVAISNFTLPILSTKKKVIKLPQHLQ